MGNVSPMSHEVQKCLFLSLLLGLLDGGEGGQGSAWLKG